MFTTAITTTLLTATMLMQAIIQDPKAVPSKADTLAAIGRFLNSPGPSDDARIINRFAEKSDDCMVGISENILPWLKHQPDYKYKGALVTGYVAGNIKAQLDSGKVGDEPYAGVLAVIKVYQALKDRDKDFTAPEIEQQIELEKKGELKAWVEKTAKDDADRRAKPAEGKKDEK